MISSQAMAQELRSVIISQDSDYYGFDLRTERDVSLEQCQSACLGDRQCRAFTYNTRAAWCFLKSDFSVLNSFAGAVAGKVVVRSGEPDLGAPPQLAFLPAEMRDEARAYRADIGTIEPQQDVGFLFLASAARDAAAGNPREAVEHYRGALAISPDESTLWSALARALLAVPQTDDESYLLRVHSGAAALNAYLTSRAATTRATALAALAETLVRRRAYRPAIQAYEASLALANDAEIRVAYQGLRQRYGFRVVEHTIDTELAQPRACVQFSEDLVKSGVDYASFITLDDAAPRAIDVATRQICVEGLEHGREYRLQVRQGLPAAIGEVIASPVALTIYVRDRAPSVRFTGPNFVLPSTGRHGVPMVSVNSASADLKLYRIGDRSLARLLTGSQFLRQLGGYDVQDTAQSMGELVWEGTMDLASELNREVLTSFPVAEALTERRPGVYMMTADPTEAPTEYWQSRATQWFVVSDIGLSTYTGEDGLTVFARSLSTALPLAGVDLQLLARNNEVLGEVATDAEGRAVFTPGLVRGTDGMAPAVLAAAAGEDDFVFLDMTSGGFDLSDRGVTGRASPGAIDVFAWTERGIYRAGEIVHVAALARDDSADAVAGLPLTFIFTRPDGTEERRMVSDGRALGGHHMPYALQPTSMRGSWSVAIHADPKAPALAQVNFLVEDFVPDRIEFDLTADRTEIAPDEAAMLSVEGRFLYGAPAAGLEIEGEVNVSTTRALPRYPGYQFGLANEDYEGDIRIDLEDLPVADADGRATFEVAVDAVPATTRLINARAVVRMREGGGRAVERALDLMVRPETASIGIRPDFAGSELAEGSNASFRILAVAPDGERAELDGALWSLVRIERNYQWYRSGNSWSYEPISIERKVAQGTLDITAREPASLSLPVEWGRYRLDVETLDPAGPASSVEFNAGWFVEAASTEAPDGLEIALDRDSYAPGDVARLQVDPRFAGELLVTIGSERLFTTLTASVPADGATIDIPVSAEWGAGAYVTAVLFRPGEATESRMPARAIGVKWLTVDPGARRLEVALAPEPMGAPRAPLAIPVTLAGLAPGETAYVAVAAVDVGILNVTGYQPPDVEGWYFGQRQLGLELRDLYGRLIDGSLGTTGRLRTGGDGTGLAIQASPPTEQLVAFFSGPVAVDADGRVTIAFDIPEFNGTVRLMAVAWSASAIGQATTNVIIRDPLVVTAGQPRFLAVGDQARIRLDIANTDGPAGDYAVSVTTAGAAGLETGRIAGTLNLADGGNAMLSLPVSAMSTGDGRITVALVHADGTRVERTMHLPVRAPSLPLTTQRVVSIAPGGGSLRIDGELLADSLLDGATVAVGVSPTSAFDVPSLLMTLDRYPYGCAEQTISRALPLLYVSELSSMSGLQDDPAMRERVQAAIDRVLTFQSSSGSFGLWGPGWGDIWLDAYVSDFLTRSREQGYVVPDLPMNLALASLQNLLTYTTDVQARGTEMAYALYVLARNRKASVGDLRYYADTRIDDFASPMARAQLAASLALYGDGVRAEQAFASALRQAQSRAMDTNYRSDYGSSLRDGAAMLALAAETRPAPSLLPAMVRFVTEERGRKSFTSTQEEAWMVLAARAIGTSGDAIRLDIDGAAHEGSYATRLAGSAIEERPMTIVNRGGQAVDAVITTVAAPADPLPAGGDGFSIERNYYTFEGEPASITEAAQNDRFVVVLRISQFQDWPARIAVTDPLPAGFEIDNPGLVGSAELSNFDWLGSPEAVHSEFLDDRFVAAFDREQGRTGDFFVAYVVRAVTPGVYVHPAAVVEDMYRPQFSARTAAGMMEVVAAR